MSEQRKTWWRSAPFSVNPRITDVCDQCGHVRWRHKRGLLGEMKCYVLGCECGPMSFGFREARHFGPLDTWTDPKTGIKLTTAQPAPPIPRPMLGRGDG